MALFICHWGAHFLSTICYIFILPKTEMREGQQDMSFEIVDALIHDQHFAVEAGVGIGKSFGYLVPVLLYNKKMKKPVIVATSTIALQEQLWDDVHDVMPLLNTDPEVILAKGQTHYLCHK